MPRVCRVGVRVGIGFGATIGPHYHHHLHGYYGGWYARPDYYWYDPWWYYPAPVVVGPPAVVERPPVVVREYTPPAPPKEPAPASDKLRQKKSVSLKTLRIGDVSNRVQAVKDLESFAGETAVRTALERALLSDRDAQVRKAITELFGRREDKKTLPTLKQAQKNDSDRDVRQTAYKAIILMEGY